MECTLEICYTLKEVKAFEKKYKVLDYIFIDDEDDDDFRIITLMLGIPL